ELAERDDDGNMTWRIELVGENGKRVWMSGQGPRLRLETKSDAAPTGLTLRYVVNLPDEKTGDGAHVPQEFAVPLVVAEEINGDKITSTDTVVQILGRPGQGLLPVGGKWHELRSDVAVVA